MPSSYLSSSSLNRALVRLAAVAAIERLVLELALCYGRIFAVAYDSTESKVGHDRMVEPSARVTALVKLVAAEQRLPSDWIEEDVKYFIAFFASRNRTDFDVFGPNLIISIAEPEHILAMKLHACQESAPPPADLHQMGFLVEKMNLGSLKAVEHLYQLFFPGKELGLNLRPIIARLLAPAI